MVHGKGKEMPRRIAWVPTVCPYLCFSTRFSGLGSVSLSCLDSGLSVLLHDLHRPVVHRTPGGWRRFKYDLPSCLELVLLGFTPPRVESEPLGLF